MKHRKSRFSRMGSKIGAGAIVAAILAVVPLSPSNATHLTQITLNSASAPQGTPSVVLTGTVTNGTDAAPQCFYGWNLSSSDGALGGATSSPQTPAQVTADYTLTVNTGALAPGIYPVSVVADWVIPAACNDHGDGVAKATITITGRTGSFSCRAYAARTQTDYQPANPAFTPCKDDNNYFAQLQPIAGLGNIGAVRATTDQQPNVLNAAAPTPADYADAQAHVAGIDLTVAGVRIRTGALWAQSSVNCQGALMTPKRNTNGTVATANLGGRAIGTTSGYVKVRILSVTVELNKVTISGNTATRQALVITRTPLIGPALKIVVAEASAGWTGNPCKAIA